jgi:hypothetical protein
MRAGVFARRWTSPGLPPYKGDRLASVFSLNARTGGVRRVLESGLPYLAITALICVLFRSLFFAPGLGFNGSDTAHYHLIQRDLQNVQLREHGRLSLWNPYSFAGVSAVSDPQSGLLYPPTWVHAFFPRELGDSVYAWSIVAHVLVAGWGMIWWLRGRGLSPLPALVGAILFAMSGKWFYHVIELGHMGFLVMIYLPWQLGLIERIAKRPRVGTGAVLGLVTAWAATGSHSQIFFYLMILLSGYALLLGLRQPRANWRAIAWTLAASLTVAVAASAAYWLPVAADLDLYGRGDGLSYGDAAIGPLRIGRWSAYFMQDPGFISHEVVRFVGIAGPLLALFAVFSRRNRDLVWFLMGVCGFAVWHALGEAGGLYRWLFDFVPGFSLFRIPSRTLILLGIGFGGLGAIGAQLALERAPGRSGRLVVAMLALLTYADLARFDTPVIRVRAPVSRAAFERLADHLSAPLGSSRVASLTDSGWLLPMPDAARAGIERVDGYNPLVPSALHEFLTRSALDSSVEFHNVGALNGLGLDGSDPAEGRRYADLLNVRWVLSNRLIDVSGLRPRSTVNARRFGMREKTTTSYLYENERVLPRAMLIRSSRHVEDRATLLAEIARFDPRAEVLVESAALAGSFPGDFEAIAVQHAVDELTLQVDAGNGGFIVLSEMWHAGWRASVNGESAPLFRANGIFQGIVLGPGRHDVVVRFAPAAFSWGVGISAFGIALAIGLGLLTLRGSKRAA